MNKCHASRGLLPLLGMLALISFLGLFPESATAQGAFGSVVGNVTDASGGAIPGASVKITLVQTNDSPTVETNEAGGSTLPTVTPCLYMLRIHNEELRSFAAPAV